MGLALARRPEIEEIALWDPEPAVLTLAMERGAGTRASSDRRRAVAGADLVLIAAPVDEIIDLLPKIAAELDPGTVVTDVGSSKGAITAAGEAAFGALFVGGHPMAGSEQHGISAASADLFEGASWILTPSAQTSADAYRRVAAVVTSVGAQAVAVPVETHDALLARISHLPQLLASLLVDVAAGGASASSLLPLAGGGFRDVTRIAASQPEMWLPILKTNREAIGETMSTFALRLEELASWLEEERWELVDRFLADARAARLELFRKVSVAGPTIQLSLLIPDRPGVLAEVTTAAGELGVNLEDLRIFHSTEGGRGRLDLVVSGDAASQALREKLLDLGYHVVDGWHE